VFKPVQTDRNESGMFPKGCDDLDTVSQILSLYIGISVDK
jgi:hypothetical protein